MVNTEMMNNTGHMPVEAMMIEDKKVPCIKKEIDGCLYTVRVHFSPMAKEKMQDKVRRMLKKEIESGNSVKLNM